MTGKKRTRCDRPSPAAATPRVTPPARTRPTFEIEMALQDDTHATGCRCQPCRIKRACLRKVMTDMARNSPGLFELPVLQRRFARTALEFLYMANYRRADS